MIYMDYAAATPLDKDARHAMEQFYSAEFYNPSATYLPAQQVRASLDDARSVVAHWLGARQSEIVFTAGGTEANNLAIAGVLAEFPNCSVVVSGIEHDSVLETARQFNCSVALVSEQGRVELDSLRRAIKDDTVLVSVMYANNEVGTIQPLRKIAAMLEDIRQERRCTGNVMPLYFHTDACQAGNYLDLHAARLGVDLMTLNGGKLYGPKQSGALFVASSVRLKPIIRGGGQERGLRSGTENVAGAVGFAMALDKAQRTRADESARLAKLQEHFFTILGEQLPQVVINGSRRQRLPNNLHITLPGLDNERVLLELESKEILAAAGSACSASNEEPSHVLRAMGVSEANAQSSLRFTTGRQTNEAHIDKLLTILVGMLPRA